MKKAELDNRLLNLTKKGKLQVPGLGVIIYKDGKKAYDFFAGNSYINNMDNSKNKAFNKDSIFRIASVSKQFTIFALMKLVEEKRISLDDDVSDFLSFKLRHPHYLDIPITIRMLASHTSGLRDGKVYSTPPAVSLKEFFTPNGMFYEDGNHFSKKDEKTGEFFCYANLNYGLLGTVIEKVSGVRFDRFLKKNIFEPLEMQGGYLVGNLSAQEFLNLGSIYRKENYSGVWDSEGKWFSYIDDYGDKKPLAETVFLQNPYAEKVNGSYSLKEYIPGTNATSLAPQGGLRTSLEGLSHALEMLINKGVYKGNRILAEKSVDEIFKLQWIYDEDRHNGDTAGGTLLNYGLGEYFIDGRSTARVCRNHVMDFVGHTGQAFGLLAGLFIRKDSRDGFVYIMNGEASPEETEETMGKFSGNFIWEEIMMDAISEFIYVLK